MPANFRATGGPDGLNVALISVYRVADRRADAWGNTVEYRVVIDGGPFRELITLTSRDKRLGRLAGGAVYEWPWLLAMLRSCLGKIEKGRLTRWLNR
jgi:hypothetical protein